MIVGNAGVLITKVLYTKDGEAKRFLIVDAAMNDLIRPSLYDAYHDIRPLSETVMHAAKKTVDVRGDRSVNREIFWRRIRHARHECR